MSWTVIAALIVIGLIFLILEILVVPGSTIVGVVGFILMAIGIWQTYIVYGSGTGHYVLAGSVILTLGALALSLRSKTWNRAMLHTEIDGKTNVYDANKVKPGDTGKAISRLVPMGKALINDEYYEVRSTGDFVDQETEVVVTKIEHNKIFVKPKK
jgi:membrane-bound ClpP family serine protease